MAANCQYSNSLTDQILKEHLPSLSHRADRNLVTGKNGELHPRNLTNKTTQDITLKNNIIDNIMI